MEKCFVEQIFNNKFWAGLLTWKNIFTENTQLRQPVDVFL